MTCTCDPKAAKAAKATKGETAPVDPIRADLDQIDRLLDVLDSDAEETKSAALDGVRVSVAHARGVLDGAQYSADARRLNFREALVEVLDLWPDVLTLLQSAMSARYGYPAPPAQAPVPVPDGALDDTVAFFVRLYQDEHLSPEAAAQVVLEDDNARGIVARGREAGLTPAAFSHTIWELAPPCPEGCEEADKYLRSVGGQFWLRELWGFLNH